MRIWNSFDAKAPECLGWVALPRRREPHPKRRAHRRARLDHPQADDGSKHVHGGNYADDAEAEFDPGGRPGPEAPQRQLVRCSEGPLFAGAARSYRRAVAPRVRTVPAAGAG